MVLAHIPKQTPTPHDRKRSGQHHKPTKHYIKTYWPYLPMFVVIIMGLIVNLTWNTNQAVLGASTDLSPTSLLQATNIDRSQHNVSTLSLNDQLDAAAQAKANDMAKRNYWAHVTPDGREPWQFITDSGYNYGAAAENLAYGFDSSGSTVAGWLSSPEHRTNMLSNTYSDVGFGVATSPDYQHDGSKTIVVAMYALPASAVLGASTSGYQASAVAASADSQDVSRITVLAGGNGSLIITAGVLLIALAGFAVILKHRRMWHRRVLKGEHFIIKHPVFDTLVVLIVVAGITLTRTTGIIH